MGMLIDAAEGAGVGFLIVPTGSDLRMRVVLITSKNSSPSYKKIGLPSAHKRACEVIKPVVRSECPKFWSNDVIMHINPTGRFVVGGPHGDTGLTGRKIIVDTYGGRGRHGGGAFSGKDPSKVDRSATYMARHIAKNIVAAGLAKQCEVQLAYAIGIPDPVSVSIDAFGTSGVSPNQLAKIVRDNFPLKPREIIEYLDLCRPVYLETARHGHFGREGKGFTWEKTNKAKELGHAADAVLAV